MVAATEAARRLGNCVKVIAQTHPETKLTASRTEREVKKANRELHNQTSRMDNLQKIEHLSKRCSDLLAEMKRHERESIKNKKRGDQLQKEKDQSRTELSKTVGLKEKLEKLCRELQKENNKLKVHLICPRRHILGHMLMNMGIEREQDATGQPD